MNKKIVLAISLAVFLLITAVYIIMKGGYFTITHDIAITSVTVPETGVYIGDIVNVIVIVRNEGSVSETFNVTSYYNITAIETKTVTDLSAGGEINLTFNWNTTDVSPANYVIKAEGSVVPSETDTVDNTYIDGIVRVRSKPAGIATLGVDPPTSMAAVGQTFSININISDVVDLYGWEFRLRWNSTLLDALNVTEGTFLKAGGYTFFTSKMNNTEGYILVDCTLWGEVPGVSGDGILATINLRVKGEGECILDLYDTILISSLEQSITHIATDGSFGR